MSNKVVRIRKFSKKYYSLLFGAIMGLIMFFLTSLTVTIVNIGIVPNFFEMWLGIFLTTFTISFLIAIVVTPFVKSIVYKITLN